MENVNVWRMSTHHIDRVSGLAWMRKNGRVAIGWGLVGDVRKFKSQDEIKLAIKNHYPVPPYKNNAHLGAPSLWDICHNVKKDDLIILSGAAPRELVVQVTGDYEYIPQDWPLEGEYRNQRIVDVTDLNPDKLWLTAGQAPGQHVYKTLIKCANSVDIDGL